MEERRRFPRFNLCLNVSWKRINDPSFKTSQNMTRNVSGGGIRLILDKALNVGDLLDLEITLPNEENIFAIGKVVWTAKIDPVDGKHQIEYDAGIELLGISEETRKEIMRFLF